MERKKKLKTRQAKVSDKIRSSYIRRHAHMHTYEGKVWSHQCDLSQNKEQQIEKNPKDTAHFPETAGYPDRK